MGKKFLFLFGLGLVLALQSIGQWMTNTASSITLSCNTFNAPSMDDYNVHIEFNNLISGERYDKDYSNVSIVNNATSVTIYFTGITGFPSDLNAMQDGKITATRPGLDFIFVWSLNQINCDGPLPVQLASFSAVKQANGTIKLTWVTYDETQMDKYYIERNPFTGAPYTDQTIGNVAALNNGANQTTYQFIDGAPHCGTNLYRLRMVGYSGYVKYSGYIAVQAANCPTGYKPDCSSIVINGPSLICSGSANYTLSNYANPNNTWAFTSNDCYATLSNNTGYSATLNKPDPNECQVTLKVTLAGCSDATKYKYKTVQLGKQPVSGYCYASNVPSQPLYLETYGINILTPGSNMVRVNTPSGPQTWELYSSTGPGISYQYNENGYLYITMPQGYAYAEFKLTIPTECGTGEYFFEFLSQDAGYTYYSLSPNPTSSDVTIAVDEQKVQKDNSATALAQKIEKLIVVDKFGNAVMQRSYPAGTKKVSFNVSTLPQDVYMVKVFNGSEWMTFKFIKK